MLPHLVLVLNTTTTANELVSIVGSVPIERRLRLVISWPGCGLNPPIETIRAARNASFRRVRLRTDALSEVALNAALEVGVDEIETLAVADVPWDTIQNLREHRRLQFLSLTVPAGDVCNHLGADECIVIAEAGDDLKMPQGFRRVALRGAPLCLMPGLDERHVISNSIEAHGLPFVLNIPFESPDRVFFEPCSSCSLLLACNGIAYSAFRDGGRSIRIRAFGSGITKEIELSPTGLARRTHPRSFIYGKANVLSVAALVRQCGRMVVSRSQARRQLSMLKQMGLRTEVLALTPSDQDRAERGCVHIFFSSDDSAERAAELERTFVLAESGSGMGADVFAKEMGKLLGYPECCINAFVEAGKDAKTTDLIRAAHRRSRRFDARLNVLDPMSPFMLIPHIPCRFDCEASLEIADGLVRALDAFYPFLGRTARQQLGRPALMLDSLVVFFNGSITKDRNGLIYTAVDTSRTSGAENPRYFEVIAQLARGDRLRFTEHSLEIFDGDRPIYRMETSVLFFPFES